QPHSRAFLPISMLISDIYSIECFALFLEPLIVPHASIFPTRCRETATPHEVLFGYLRTIMILQSQSPSSAAHRDLTRAICSHWPRQAAPYTPRRSPLAQA